MSKVKAVKGKDKEVVTGWLTTYEGKPYEITLWKPLFHRSYEYVEILCQPILPVTKGKKGGGR